MHIEETVFPGVKIVHVDRYTDSRGDFSETYRRDVYASLGIETQFVQDNQSTSRKKGTVRGLHFQHPPFAQAKLVRVVQGAIFDVAVDLRQGSPTFGKHVAMELTAKSGNQALIPGEFAHGFCTLVPDTIVIYKTSRPYAQAYEGGVLWSDPDLAIDWPVAEARAFLSDKDRDLPRLKTIENELPPVILCENLACAG